VRPDLLWIGSCNSYLNSRVNANQELALTVLSYLYPFTHK
jgi:hypothetical protein